MSLIMKRKEFERPDEGPHDGTLADITETTNGPKERIKFTWELDTKGKDGRPLKVFQSFNNCWNPLSKLWEAVEQLLGKEPPENFNLEKLKGSRRCLYIMHDTGNDGRVWANVHKIAQIKTKNLHGLEIDDSDIPFDSDEERAG